MRYTHLVLLGRIANTHIGVGETGVTIKTLLIGLLILYAFVTLSRTSKTVLRDNILPGAGVKPALTQVISTLVGAMFLVVAGFFAAVSVAGVDLGALGFIIGGLSVGIGLSLQDIIGNFISGFVLLFENSIVPNDVIKVDGNIGRVECSGPAQHAHQDVGQCRTDRSEFTIPQLNCHQLE